MAPKQLDDYGLFSDTEMEAARHVLAYYGLPGGRDGSAFMMNLIRTIESADVLNRYTLLRAFPEYLPAYTILTAEGGEALAVEVALQAGRTPR
jgi:hypothetical protein